MAHYYRDTVEGAGTRDDPLRPAHEGDHGADPANYNRHYRGGQVVIASRVRIPTYEELDEDPDSPVEALDEATVDADGYPVPEADEGDEEGDGE